MSETAVEVAKAAEFATMAGPEPASLALEIVRLAANPQIDVAKLGALIDLQERVERRDAEGAFNRAFAEMQARIPVIVERGKADRGEKGGAYSYAKFEDVLDVLRPILHAHGFGISHETEYPETGTRVKVTGILTHRDGHSRRSVFVAGADSGGGKNSVQAMGSSTSYGRRYTTFDLLGIATRAQDDDAQAAEQKPGPDGFDDWWSDLTAVADTGVAALEKAWADSSKELKAFAFKHRAKEWKALKAKAEGVTRGA